MSEAAARPSWNISTAISGSSSPARSFAVRSPGSRSRSISSGTGAWSARRPMRGPRRCCSVSGLNRESPDGGSRARGAPSATLTMARDELLEAVRPRRTENLSRRTLFLDDTLVQEHDPARHVLGEAHLVRDHQHGPALLGQGAHDAEHLADEFRIEGRGGLVEEHHLRSLGERTSDRRALLLPAREVRGIVVSLVRDADLGEDLLGFREAIRLGAPLHVDRSLHTFSRTVMWDHRLKFWNTMATRVRIR